MVLWPKSGINQYNLNLKNREIESCELFKNSKCSQKQVSETNISVKTNPAINSQSIFS